MKPNFKEYLASGQWEKLGNRTVRVETEVDEDEVTSVDFYIEDPLLGDLSLNDSPPDQD